ncbi:MAG: cell division protein FtsZ [Candidatus Micrarchaeia archaeon]
MEEFVKSVVNNARNEPTQAYGPSGDEELKIAVVGCGGGGNNTVNRIKKLGVKGAELYVCNTDRAHLSIIDDGIHKILIGKALTKGLGAGGYPEVGRKAAEQSREEIVKNLEGTNLLFLCAGMGGGTGTGSAPVVAQVAKEMGAIVIAMVTYPFALERARLQKADQGIADLRKYADSVIILDNNRLAQIVPNLPMNQAFLVADEILAKAISGLVFTIKQPSLVNIDFADVRAIMGGGDVGFISVGSGKGPNKVEDAVKGVLENRLLDVDFDGAKGAILHIAGGSDLTLGDAIGAGERITDKMSASASVKWGARIVPEYDGKLEICAIVTGVKSPQIAGRAFEETKKAKGQYDDIEIVG